MPIQILMPALSPTMTEGKLAKWLKNEGDSIKAGQVIAEIETDKATMEVEAVDEGILAKILVPAGTEAVAVNSMIAVILEKGETADDLTSFLNNTAQAAPISAQIAEEKTATTTQNHSKPLQQQNTSATRIFASPLARRIAESKKIDLAKVQGTGPHGRIVKADIEKYAANAVQSRQLYPVGSYRAEPISSMRKIIASRLVESKHSVPHFYLTAEYILDKIMEARTLLSTPENKISVNDFVVKATAMAMRKVPEVNASWADDEIRFYNNVDIAVAVAIDGGLITPIVRNADIKPLGEVSAEIKQLAKRAKENRLMPEEYQGGGFSISNLGMYGIKQFCAIINPPQSCILAVGAGNKRVVVENDQMVIRTVMDLTLSCDHRVVDGAVGAEFLKQLKLYIENPIKIFADNI